MNRDEMVDKVTHELKCEVSGLYIHCSVAGRIAVDALLPQVSTVEELEALQLKTGLIGADGSLIEVRDGGGYPSKEFSYGYTSGRREFSSARVIKESGPLTVVWQP